MKRFIIEVLLLFIPILGLRWLGRSVSPFEDNYILDNYEPLGIFILFINFFYHIATFFFLASLINWGI